MKTFDSNDSFFAALRILIEKWCDRRCLKALQNILGAYLAFNGLTDSWADLHIALQNVRASARTELNAEELEALEGLIRAADRRSVGDSLRASAQECPRHTNTIVPSPSGQGGHYWTMGARLHDGARAGDEVG